MDKIAIIENNIVKNIILGNSDFAESYDGVAIILKDENVSIGYIYKNKKFTAPVKTSEQIEGEARTWRNMELISTDWIVPLADYPNHAAWLTYREELRNWPSTENFPDIKPSKP